MGDDDLQSELTVIAAGHACAFELSAGQRLWIETPEGGQVADFTFRGFHQALTRRINGTLERGPGHVPPRGGHGAWRLP